MFGDILLVGQIKLRFFILFFDVLETLKNFCIFGIKIRHSAQG